MESSSEDSFAWTDTSKDSIDIDSMAVDEIANTKSETKHVKKRKSRKTSNDVYNGTEEEQETKINIKIEKDQLQSEHKINESVKRKLVKLEPESDYDVPKKKKKNKHVEVNGNEDLQDSYDESYLDMKVKKEEMLAPQSKKKKKRNSVAPIDTDNSAEINHQDNSSDNLEEKVKHKKKKKKSKKRHDSGDEDGMDTDLLEDTTETTVNKSSTNRIAGNSLTDNNTFQNESGSDEISAIQADGDDSHIISFNDSSNIVKESNKKNDTLYKSTIDNQFKMASNKIDHNSEKEPGRRTLRLSDRIQFEDDDEFVPEDSEVQESKQDKTSSKLRNFIKSSKDIKLVTQKIEQNAIITDDDELWIVKCPKEIDIRAFCNINLNLNEKFKIKVDGHTYEGILEEGQGDTIAALSITHDKYDVQNLPLSGIINLHKRIPKAHFRDDNIMVNNQTNFIPLPDTKCRHPLFGTNYKKAIKVPSAVAERLNAESNVEETAPIVKRKKKKHKKDRDVVDNQETNVKSNSILKSDPDAAIEVKSEKKKKKRKHTEDVDVVDGPAPKKAKRIKHDPESAEAWESEKAIEENLFNF